ncbi:MAG: hypothetical protein EXR60_06270 [Dehalococcoidia bacterium]|nr:hypothetical protein [Dehalococcoidia bacterium]
MNKVEVILGLALAILLGLLLGTLILAAALIVIAMLLVLIPVLLAMALFTGLLGLVLIKTPAGPWLLARSVRPAVRVGWSQRAWRRFLVRSPRNGHTEDEQR